MNKELKALLEEEPELKNLVEAFDSVYGKLEKLTAKNEEFQDKQEGYETLITLLNDYDGPYNKEQLKMCSEILLDLFITPPREEFADKIAELMIKYEEIKKSGYGLLEEVKDTKESEKTPVVKTTKKRVREGVKEIDGKHYVVYNQSKSSEYYQGENIVGMYHPILNIKGSIEVLTSDRVGILPYGEVKIRKFQINSKQ